MLPSASAPPTVSARACRPSRTVRGGVRLLRLVADAWRRGRDAHVIANLSPHERERHLKDTWAERRAGP